MRRWRRLYYDIFSSFYDGFVALHSHDRLDAARRFLTDQVPVQNGNSVLDLCTGTGTLLAYLNAKVGTTGQVVGVDFSSGMLRKAREKIPNLINIRLVEADAAHLPFAAGSFDAVTCSHAFYELKGETRHRALREIVRVLKPSGTFLMMEHEVPSNPLIRVLFYLRLRIAGAGRPAQFLRQEQEMLARHFAHVEKLVAPGGHSKILICRKGCP